MRVKVAFMTVGAMLLVGGFVSAHERKEGILIDSACGKRLAGA